MNKHLYLLGFLSVFLLATGVSCKDKDPKPKQNYCSQSGTCETVMEAKDYFVFNMGSWWVYEEETSHERDSVYVILYNNDPDSPDFDVTVFSEREDMRYHYFPQIISNNGCYNYSLVSENKCIYIKRSKGNFGNYIGEDNCFFIQHRKSDCINTSNVYYPNDKLCINDIYATYNLSGFNFDRTIKIYEEHTFVENNEATNHYYSKGIGLIRKELVTSSQVWNLVSYHIEL